MKNIFKILVTGAVAAALTLGGATAAQAVVGDPNGVETYIPGPTYIDDCGTSKDKILVGNTSKINWWVYMNADGTRTASAYPKPGYYVPDGTETVYDFPAFTDTCNWINEIPAPVRTGSGPYDIALTKVPGASWRFMQVSGGTKVWLQPNIGYGIPTGVQSSWVL